MPIAVGQILLVAMSEVDAMMLGMLVFVLILRGGYRVMNLRARHHRPIWGGECDQARINGTQGYRDKGPFSRGFPHGNLGTDPHLCCIAFSSGFCNPFDPG